MNGTGSGGTGRRPSDGPQDGRGRGRSGGGQRPRSTGRGGSQSGGDGRKRTGGYQARGQSGRPAPRRPEDRDAGRAGSEDQRPRRRPDGERSGSRGARSEGGGSRSTTTGRGGPERARRGTERPGTDRPLGTDRQGGTDRPRGERRATSDRTGSPRATGGQDRRGGRPSGRSTDPRPGGSQGSRSGGYQPRSAAGPVRGRSAGQGKDSWSRDPRPGDKGRPARSPRLAEGTRRRDPEVARGARRPERTERPVEQREPLHPGLAPKPNEPATPTGLDLKALPRAVRAELRSLTPEHAEVVGAHLLMAGQLIDTDPELAYAHAEAARRRAARLPVTREATGETAYAAGHFDVALNEFRALRRMSGTTEYLPAMADCERALGRPQAALRLVKEGLASNPDVHQLVELRLVEAGVRVDSGQAAEALRLLRTEIERIGARGPKLARARLRFGYADLLEASGDTELAERWFLSAAALDVDGATDAAERAARLQGVVIFFDEDEEDEPAPAADEQVADERETEQRATDATAPDSGAEGSDD